MARNAVLEQSWLLKLRHKPDFHVRDDPDGPDDSDFQLQFFGHSPLIAMYRDSAGHAVRFGVYVKLHQQSVECISLHIREHGTSKDSSPRF